MLKQLNIKNLILIEMLTTPLEEGFNVITGETGAGKSAIMSSLKLITGQRADPKVIRKGADKATVEAHFELKNDSPIYQLLKESGIDINAGEDLIIKREVPLSGKGKAYINHQMAQLTLLKKVGELLIQIVGQHANQRLVDEEEHRNIIDIFGDNKPLLLEFQKSWKQQHLIEKKLHELLEGEASRLREIERCLDEIAELESANMQEGEDEELFADYTLFAHAEELANKAHSIHAALNHSSDSIIPQLNKQKHVFEELLAIDPSIMETVELFTTAKVEIEEVAHSLSNYMSKLDNDPHRAEIVNERLTLIEKLKRKYGPSYGEIQEYLETSKKKLEILENSDYEIDELKKNLETTKLKNEQLAKKISEERKSSALNFEQTVIKELYDLNMPKVQFKVKIDPQSRTINGDDRVEFFFAPNVGENMIPVKSSASGGEISRILLAVEKILSTKNHIPTIIFDEIDANIGGETAVVIGGKLHEIGQAHQVLCITHFPQVAMQAEHHLQIKKVEKEGRTLSIVTNLCKDSRQGELDRMLGKSIEVKAALN